MKLLPQEEQSISHHKDDVGGWHKKLLKSFAKKDASGSARMEIHSLI